MNIYNILAIAPYKGLAEVIKEVSNKYIDKIKITTVVGDLSEGAEYAKKAQQMGYDLIISRGGTSEMIMQVSNLPIVNIEISGYDLMRAIKVADRFQDKTAIVGFPYITDGAKSVSSVIQTEIRFETIYSIRDIEEKLVLLRDEGYGLIIGDAATERTAKQMGMSGMLLSTGEESVKQAIEDAIYLMDTVEPYKDEIQIYKSLMDNMPIDMIAFSNGEEIYQSPKITDKQLVTSIKQFSQHSWISKEQNTIVTSQDDMYQVSGKLIDKENKPLSAYYISKLQRPKQKNIQGVKIRNDHMESKMEISPLRAGETYGVQVERRAQMLLKSGEPIIIYGEKGTGKKDYCYYLHQISTNYSQPYVEFYCGLIGEDQWDSVTKWWSNELSKHGGATLAFIDIDRLSSNSQERLHWLIHQYNLLDNSRIFSTTNQLISKIYDEERYYRPLFDDLFSLSLSLPSLNDRLSDIETISSFYIIDANTQWGKQVVGLTSQAIQQLRAYSWPYNYFELRNIITSLVIGSVEPYISEQEVKAELKRHTKSENLVNQEFLEGTLADIELRVINKVLEEEDGNMGRTAERLNIGRSTLWRKLKDS